MARYSVNDAAVQRCRELIEARQYVLDSDWGDVQPRADDENGFLDRHDWTAYGAWHLGLTEGANDETKARYAFVYGDYRRVHRSGADRLRLPGLGMAAQSGRAGGPRPAPTTRRTGRHHLSPCRRS